MALDMGTVRDNTAASEPAAAPPTGFGPELFEPATEISPPLTLAGGPATLVTHPAASENPLEGAAARLFERWLATPLPLIGKRPVQQQVQVMATLMLLLFMFTVIVIAFDARTASSGSRQIEIVGQLLMHSQRLAKAAPEAVQGNPTAFDEMVDSRDQIDLGLDALINGDPVLGVSASSMELQDPLHKLQERWKPTQSAASLVIAQRKTLTAFGAVVQRINEASPRLLELTEGIAADKLRQGAGAREVAAAGQLVTLTQRMGRSANALVQGGRGSAEEALVLGRDANAFHDLAQGLLDGSDPQRLQRTAESETRAKLQEVLRIYKDVQAALGDTLSALPNVVDMKNAERAILADAEPFRRQILAVDELYAGEQRGRAFDFWLMAAFGFGALACALGVAKLLLTDSRGRALEAEQGRSEAQRLEDQAKRRNEQNQSAILRLMNELQEVADGNLTVQATVSEDITGAIADSVNYTVEELRGLVGRINTTAEEVNTASRQARDIATRLLTASEAQSREIRGTGEKVLQMAGQIHEISGSAGESAKVARASLDAAERGPRAVYNQIAGMNEIRDQIQETAKRIKRLGESSQEIGEIVELITDITEQTNVLALNAAIQAASAGDAGRGFSVVAEEVQRLADRSAEAAKQIGALVRTIQTDTQDAVGAMEKSTQGVVEGTKLSDAAGTALADIGRVSRQLAELIERIATTTSEQADSAGGVALSIERILTVTEQTSEGTREAAQSIGQLANLARELKASVARFRVA